MEDSSLVANQSIVPPNLRKKKIISPLDDRVFEPVSAASYKKQCFKIPAKTDVLLNFNQMVESNAR